MVGTKYIESEKKLYEAGWKTQKSDRKIASSTISHKYRSSQKEGEKVPEWQYVVNHFLE